MIFEKEKESEKRNVLVGIRFDGHIRELLNWAIVKFANPGDRVVALHVCRNSDSIAKDKSLLDTYLDDYDGLCNKKQVDIISLVLKGSSIRRVLVREAKNHSAVAVVVGTSKHSTLGSWTSISKYCAKRLPITTEIMAIDNGKVFFRRSSNSQLKGSFSDPKPSLQSERSSTLRDCLSEFVESEISEMGRFSYEVSNTENPKEETVSSLAKHKKNSLSLGSISLPTEDFAADRPGWPLLQTASSLNQPAKVVRKMSVVQWVMTLPNRSMLDSPKSDFSPKDSPNAFGMEQKYFMDCNEKESASVCNQLIKDLQLILEANSSGIKWFSYDVLKSSTSNFSSEKLIGKGGRNSVYKAQLSDGKSVAVKISSSSEEARKDFRQEMDIMTRVKHMNIANLLGICIEDSHLISVYNFLSQGNLEENIHAGRSKSVLQWERRFKIAVGIAEALNYLHNECPRPVIHRDVKSSNILLSDDFEPQLSDFGLAIWGPTKASYLTHSDVVGTFGYLAPEYFMYGKVSDKIDIYSFGVVLLELLSGRKAIGFETPSGQESLVMWAKPKLESEDIKAILDENLDVNVEDDKVQRMILAAKLCLTQAARLRPNINQILKMLKGEKDGNEEANGGSGEDHNNIEEYNDDEVYPDSSAESHLSLALLDVNDNSTSFSSSQDQSSPLSSVDEYLRKTWSRSSSSEY
ncbi:protein kinase STUNTED-like isoform X1 [Nicotiana tomentosiformis]|uniref:protein kinase STUNTED-like isoform X1 n=1 Tax=Nicotiana tomentosiformis TaxID=4098 RepID=UPI00051C7D7F|nr:proline-rich receptor-like protein kinase PERK12 isoform X1 [Nicotiana tomentosiformis]XP_033517494.1 proline-rich receptor-like protein kinase PERK12 isoform X1 [Nicotiana tomentosiformis]